MKDTQDTRSTAEVLESLLGKIRASEANRKTADGPEERKKDGWNESPTPAGPGTREPANPDRAEISSGRYDFDLAEFPLFHYSKHRLGAKDLAPLRYSDTISGKDGKTVAREWLVYPGTLGFGGSSTQELLYDLLQLYVEQGCQGSQIQFGTLRSLFLRRGDRNPSKRDYDRLRRDLDILRGYDIQCKNAFWDRGRRAYVDMKWRLFGSVFFFRESHAQDGEELPFGFIEVSQVLQQIARTRGFFALGFESRYFYSLKPLEQRLAIYLAKKFVSQKIHRRYVDDLVKALPILAERPRNNLALLKKSAEGLLAKKLPILDSFHLEKARNGKTLAVFRRKVAPKQDWPFPAYAGEELAPGLACLVDRIVEATGNSADRLWWTQCAKRLGLGAVDRALGQLKEARQLGQVRNPGGLLTKIFKDIAEESGVALH